MRKEKKEVFKTIYGKYKDLIYYVILKIVREKNIARKLTMDTIEYLSQSVETDSINSSIIAVAKDIAIADYKAKSDHEVSNEEIERVEGMPVGDFDGLLDKYFKTVEKDIILLHVAFSFSFRETSELLGVPLKEVRTKYKESQNKLKLILKETEK